MDTVLKISPRIPNINRDKTAQTSMPLLTSLVLSPFDSHPQFRYGTPASFNPESYTVGWICAILPEYVCAQAVLNETHEVPDVFDDQDNNDYALGKIGKHNVVIATLPAGEYGLVSAASVARDMLRSFPNIRIGLMVGLGGGAPSDRHDIRLGDVVVSTPGEGEGGVFQYDYGRDIQDQDFQNIAHLDKPPLSLRTAKRNPDCEKFIAVQAKLPTNSTQSPVSIPQRLLPCTQHCGDPIPRPERTKDEDPSIHYGLIASSNKLMKNAIVRDELASKKGVLCFEMEAAGLMNHFPCVVIRGICDYSDTHKNKDWQGKVEAEKRIIDMLDRVTEATNRVESKVGVAIAKVGHLVEDAQQDKVKRWLNPPDPSVNENDAKIRRHPGTGAWLIKSDFLPSG
ncbi:unnamed protein product [Parascedosporium putredinis]|uniref:Nucleoside phosphorylase domain-containing protein n=1 Tax=Parascedosporium putredinis TaxID=1442378 RepID=A0A9P1H647_9PEZI|nr:unnamed protein product [Parascedosporium putredinis]CAI7997071.1 unnamed protein product [Parascedosporium putredinis]